MSIPVIAAAAAFDALKIMSGSVTVDQPLNYALGGVTACIVGLFLSCLFLRGSCLRGNCIILPYIA